MSAAPPQSCSFTRRLVTIALPIVLQNLMLALVAAADALMLGRFSQNAMAAVSLATQVQFIQNILLWCIVSGVAILGAQYWGKGDRAVMGRIFGISIRQAAAVSVVFFIGCRYFPEKLMLLFAHDPELVRVGAEYLRIAAWSYLITGVSQCCLGIMKVSDHVGCSAVISSGAVALNIVFNAVLIFGLAGFPALGAAGAAWATVGARSVELVWCLAMSCRKSFIHLEWKNVTGFDRALSADFLRYTLPILGSAMLWGVGFAAYTAIMGHLGADSAAANSVAAVVRDLMCCLCNGVAGAAGILIGNELGAGRLETGRRYGDKLALLSFGIGLVCTATILAAIPVAEHFIELSDTARHYMRGMFAILSVYMIVRSVCTVVINGIFSAGGDTLFDVYSLVVCMWCVALPCAFAGAFLFHLPVLAVYACTCLDEVGKIPWVLLHHRRYKWVRDLTR